MIEHLLVGGTSQSRRRKKRRLGQCSATATGLRSWFERVVRARQRVTNHLPFLNTPRVTTRFSLSASTSTCDSHASQAGHARSVSRCQDRRLTWSGLWSLQTWIPGQKHDLPGFHVYFRPNHRLANNLIHGSGIASRPIPFTADQVASLHLLTLHQHIQLPSAASTSPKT